MEKFKAFWTSLGLEVFKVKAEEEFPPRVATEDEAAEVVKLNPELTAAMGLINSDAAGNSQVELMYDNPIS